MMWQYKSSVGTFWIAPQRGVPGRYTLGIDDNALGSYHSPEAAADDVYTQSTGCHKWDTLGNLIGPSDLREWEYSATSANS